MTSYSRILYLTIYKPRSEDVTEAAVLVPAAGAPHGDNFKVCSQSGVAGFKEYLDAPSFVAAEGASDLLTKRLEVGEYMVDLIDKRVSGGTNAQRWVTAFLGNVNGANRLSGCKALFEESTDGGSTKVTIATVRVADLRKIGTQKIRMVFRNAVNQLKADIFVSDPHYSIIYAKRLSLLPVGLQADYGPYPAVEALHGTVFGAPVSNTKSLVIKIDDDQFTDRPENLITKQLDDLLTKQQAAADGGDRTIFPDYLRVIVDGTVYYKLRDIRKLGGIGAAKYLYLNELVSTDPQWSAYNTYADTNAVTVMVVPGPATKISQDFPLLIDDVAIGTFLADLLSGKFGNLNADTGAVLRTFPYDATAVALLTDVVRFVITEKWKLVDFIEQQLCQQGIFAYRVSTANEFYPVDLKLPSTAPSVPTITDDDLEAVTELAWELTRQNAVTRFDINYYIDDWRPVTYWKDLYGTSVYDRIPPGGIRWTQSAIVDPNFGASDLDENAFGMDLLGLRASVGNEVTNGRGRADYVKSVADQIMAEAKPAFSRGTIKIPLTCRRTSNTVGLVGDFVKVNINALPNPSGSVRGGTRLMRIVRRREQGPRRFLLVQDSGVNVVNTVPTLGTITAETGNETGVKVPVNALGAGATEVWVAMTATSVGSAPAGTSALWRLAVRVTATGNTFVRNLPHGQRAWIRARAVSFNTDVAQLPSAFVYAVTPAYIDTGALSAPTAIAFANINASSFDVTFTPGETGFPTTCDVDPAVAGVSQFKVPAGAVRFRITHAIASTAYDVDLYHEDGLGGSSALDSDTVTTAAAPSLSAPHDLTAVVSYPAVGNLNSAGELVQGALVQIWMICATVDAGVLVALHYAEETAEGSGSYGSYIQEYRTPVSGDWTKFPGPDGGIIVTPDLRNGPVPLGERAFFLEQPERRRKYKARLELDDGTSLSSFSTEITVTPTGGDSGIYGTPIALVNALVQPASSQPRNRCRVYKSASQAITTGTNTDVTWNLEEYDTGTLHDNATNNARITIPTGGNTGVWIFTANITWGAGTTGIRELSIYNSSGRIGGVTMLPHGTSNPAQSVTVAVDAPAAGEYYKVVVRHSEGANLDVVGILSEQSSFSATHLW